MTTFKEIRGTAIESVSSDPSNPEVGQIWYNNTIGVLKGYALVAAAWSAGGNMGTLRNRLAGAGIQTSALGFGGYIGGSGITTATEEYDGSSWAGGGNMATARSSLGGCGTQTAGLAIGGNTNNPVRTVTEEYNGTSWGPGGNLGTGREIMGAAGTQTAGLAFGGFLLLILLKNMMVQLGLQVVI
jgi:hypothetical protein